MAVVANQPPTFMGRVLPRLRKGNVWTVTFWPGGRKVVSQTQRDYVGVTSAVVLLSLGMRATVLLHDAEAVATAVQLEAA